MKMIRLCGAILSMGMPVSVLAHPASQGAEPVATNVLSLERVIEEVTRKNPSLQAASANWEAMKQRVPQARAWEDPRVGVDFERSGTTRFDTFTDNEWMVMQQIPVTGKNRLRGRAAIAEAAASFSELRRRELDVTSHARVTYYRLANAYEQLELNRRNVGLLRQFVELGRARYEVATQHQGDVLLAESDLARLEEARLDIERIVSDQQSQLNVLMNRPAQAPLGRPAGLRLSPLELDLERVQKVALAHRPELLSAQKRIEAAKARLDLAKRAWIPDPEIRIEGRQFNGRGGGIQEYDTGIFFNFPWPIKYKAAAEEARQTHESAQYELEAARTEALGLVRDRLKEIETFHHHTLLFRDRIVPLTQQAVRATQAAYETEKASFLDLLVAQRTSLEVESMYFNHLTSYLAAVAELEAATGIDEKENPQPKKGNEP